MSITTATGDNNPALDRLREREDVLQICYWYQGEGLGNTFTPRLVQPFLSSEPGVITAAFDELVRSGELEQQETGYTFTPVGKRKAARMFTETFVDFQQPGHGECQDGCCDGDEPCAHHAHSSAHVHTAACQHDNTANHVAQPAHVDANRNRDHQAKKA